MPPKKRIRQARHANVEVPEVVRMRHVLYLEVTDNDIDLENNLLLKSYAEVTPAEYIHNQVYFDALRVREEQMRFFENNRNQALRDVIRAEKVVDLTRKFSPLYSAADTERLIQNLPEVVFTANETRRVTEVTLQEVVRRVFAALPALDVVAEARKIWLAIYEQGLPEVLNPDDTPDFTINAQNLLVVNSARSEFYPFKYIFVRQCYLDLLPQIIDTAQNSVVALIGDPGIGKSTFLRFVFASIVANRNTRQKVFWEMESGFWRYFDGQNRHSGIGDSDLWMRPDVLLLLDGTFKPRYLHKTKNVVLFCSPQHSSYDRMIKFASGAIFVMASKRLIVFVESLSKPVRKKDSLL